MTGGLGEARVVVVVEFLFVVPEEAIVVWIRIRACGNVWRKKVSPAQQGYGGSGGLTFTIGIVDGVGPGSTVCILESGVGEVGVPGDRGCSVLGSVVVVQGEHVIYPCLLVDVGEGDA